MAHLNISNCQKKKLTSIERTQAREKHLNELARGGEGRTYRRTDGRASRKLERCHKARKDWRQSRSFIRTQATLPSCFYFVDFSIYLLFRIEEIRVAYTKRFFVLNVYVALRAECNAGRAVEHTKIEQAAAELRRSFWTTADHRRSSQRLRRSCMLALPFSVSVASDIF